jgi:hypothetical protein
MKRGKAKSKAAPRAYPENVFLVSNDQLFKLLARKYLNIYNHEEYESPEVLGFRAVAGWWMKLDNGDANVVRQGVHVSASFGAGAHAGIQVRNFWDPKHWGEWEDFTNLCIEFRISSFGIDAVPIFKDDGVYLALKLGDATGIKAHWCGDTGVVPGELLDWILTKIEEGLYHFLRVVIALVNIKVANYPSTFPGTALVWKPTMNRYASNNGPYLTFSGDPSFP